MAETTTITLRIPVEMRDKLDRLAKAMDRSRSYVAAEAIELFVEDQIEILDGIEESIADFEAGRFFTHEEVVADSKRLLDEAYARDAAPTAEAVQAKKVVTR